MIIMICSLDITVCSCKVSSWSHSTKTVQASGLSWWKEKNMDPMSLAAVAV